MTDISAGSSGRWAGAALAAALAVGLLVGWVGDLEAKETFPKIANVYFPTLSEADIELLAQWDMLVLPKRAQTWDQEELTRLRELNPDIVLLVHMPVGYNGAWTGPEDNAVLTNKLNACDWWLRDTTGAKVMANAQDGYIDVTTKCPTDSQGKRLCDWLPEYISERLGPGGWWDGVFLDFCMSEISWLNNYIPDPIDVDRDGLPDSREEIDTAWDDGMRILVSGLRGLVGDDYIIVTNGNNTYYDMCDGSTRENFPNMHGDWYDNITHEEYGYMTMDSRYRTPSVNIINAIWWGPSTLGGPVRTPEFERKFGFTFASTLVFGDGYFSLDGPSHSQAWWHEYYDLDLGRARGGAVKPQAVPGARPDLENAEMIRVRRFEKGLAAVNPTNCSQTIDLGGVYYYPDSWNGSFYPNGASTMTLVLGGRSGGVVIGSGRMLANAGGLTGVREGGVNSLEWNSVGGATSYSVYRVDLGADGAPGEETLVAVVEGRFFDDAGARTSRSRYSVAAIDEIGCEGQRSCPVEVSSGLGSDLSLALVVVDEPDGTLALSWNQGDAVDGVVFDVVRTGEAGERVVMTDAPIDPTVTTRWIDTSVVPGREYVYEAVVDLDGEEVVIGSVAGRLPETFSATVLRGCYPHPMVSSTTFAFDVGGDERGGRVEASLTVYDAAGRVVRRLLNEAVAPGPHTVSWDGRTDAGRRVASGCYLYALTAGDEVRSGKVLVVR